MTEKEFEKLLPGDRAIIEWYPGAKQFNVTVVDLKSYDTDPEPETVLCAGINFYGEVKASQLTFVAHALAIEALLMNNNRHELAKELAACKVQLDYTENCLKDALKANNALLSTGNFKRVRELVTELYNILTSKQGDI